MNIKFGKVEKICLVLILISIVSITSYFFIKPYFIIPEINLVGEETITIDLNSDYSDLGAVAKLDNKDISDLIEIDGKVDVKKTGDYTIVYSITNLKGYKKREVKRVVKVRDSVKPTLKLKGSTVYKVSYGSKYVDPGYSAKDNYDGDLTKNVIVSGTVDTYKIGSYKINYSIVDSSGNKITKVRTVKVIDDKSPVITLSGGNSIKIEVNSSYNEYGYSARDNYDGDLTDDVYVSGKVNPNIPGVYEVFYSVSDSFGNYRSVIRTVQVGDQSDIDALNYIKVSISEQKLWYYKNGKLVVSSDVVTGYKGKHDTKKGRFRVNGLVRGTYLIGKDYKSWVDYWIPIDSYGLIGLHDASWRTSFGGNIYTYDGSHGCVNMPYNKVQKLYSSVLVGTLVIIN